MKRFTDEEVDRFTSWLNHPDRQKVTIIVDLPFVPSDPARDRSSDLFLTPTQGEVEWFEDIEPDELDSDYVSTEEMLCWVLTYRVQIEELFKHIDERRSS